MERSLKEAIAELGARLQTGAERHFPVMGLKGAAAPLMLREAVLALNRPLLAVTPLSSEAESLAAEMAFFLGQAPGTGALENRDPSAHRMGSYAFRADFAAAGQPERRVRRALRAGAPARTRGDHLG